MLVPIAGYILTVLIAYLLGSIPTGFLVARARGIDIRTVGSGATVTNFGSAQSVVNTMTTSIWSLTTRCRWISTARPSRCG